MRSTIRVADLKRAQELAGRFERIGSWAICEDYVVRGGDVISKYAPSPWVLLGEEGREEQGEPGSPPYPDPEDLHWEEYEPLKDAPDLFLKLAALHEEGNFERAALAFCRRYGLPGGSSSERWGRPDKMSLSLFREEAKRAWTILRMYEAALKQDREGATRLMLEHHAEIAERIDNLEDVSVLGVLMWSVTLVTQTVSSLCRPGVSFEGLAKGEPDASGIRSAWFFNNLLGAAYLQIYWLMTSAGELARCEYCGGVMSLARPRPGDRKRRRDKRFCNDACRQAHRRARVRA